MGKLHALNMGKYSRGILLTDWKIILDKWTTKDLEHFLDIMDKVISETQGSGEFMNKGE